MTRPALTREEISDFRDEACSAALGIIAEHGLDALTFRSLGAKLGCSYAKPYRYFEDKEQLIDALRAHAFALFTDHMRIEPSVEVDGALLSRYVDFALQNSAAFELMFGFNQNYVSTETRRAEDAAWDVCARPLYSMVDAGELVGDPMVIAHLFWSALHGISTLTLAGKLTHGMEAAGILDSLGIVFDAFRPPRKDQPV